MRNTYYTYLLLGSTILSGTMLNLGVAQAACVSTPDCESLGYTETSCTNGGVKCPWNTSKLFCGCGAAYAYSCTGSNETGGSGTACGGKYASCTCASGYDWNGSGCAQNCIVGSILNSDMTCTPDKVSGKAPIGVVSYVNGSKRIAIQLEDPDQRSWNTSGSDTCAYKDISGIPNYTDSSTALNDYNGKSNTAAYISVYDSSCSIRNFAQFYCNAYNTIGTSAGDWYLPAAGELYASLWTNKPSVDAGLSRAGGTAMAYNYYWSSSESSSSYAWVIYSQSGYPQTIGKSTAYSFRCVLAF